MAVEVGTQAPDFTLNDYNKQEVTLSSFRGDKPVLLVFYPFAFSGICQGELCQLRDEFDQYTNVQVLGVSVDTPFALKAWAEQQGYQFPLLSDFWPHGEVAKKYGVFNEQAGLALRGTFLIDTEGIVRFAEVNQPGEPRNQEAWKKAVADLV
ncbi:peroxiredoxin [Saccharomonospora viridis]|jgi:peroxiredoxin|uniref:Alkyl hydroperoxide reductase E n=2 Tax=Saccharomonospora viridis TaxID=1852 RepID=C7MYW9_SACVD|nr:peroxiredoxin [Saccharomonospora viridis]ACU96090.1 Peroxiredoxin [Saccharomonospora viridis DSM 43017]KHF45410.1 peroxiredoxin [Saccharomonospora viridis]SFP77391.1 Peroxiredoxin [Saccharomonospora viridis]